MKKAIHYLEMIIRERLFVRSTQTPLFTPETEWVMPEELKDLLEPNK